MHVFIYLFQLYAQKGVCVCITCLNLYMQSGLQAMYLFSIKRLSTAQE